MKKSIQARFHFTPKHFDEYLSQIEKEVKNNDETKEAYQLLKVLFDDIRQYRKFFDKMAEELNPKITGKEDFFITNKPNKEETVKTKTKGRSEKANNGKNNKETKVKENVNNICWVVMDSRTKHCFVKGFGIDESENITFVKTSPVELPVIIKEKSVAEKVAEFANRTRGTKAFLVIKASLFQA